MVLSYAERKFVIVEMSELTDFDYAVVMEDNADTLRKNLTGTHAVLKYEGRKPSALYGKTILNYAEIKALLATDEWRDPDPPQE